MGNFEECIDMEIEDYQKIFEAPNMYSLAEAKADSISCRLLFIMAGS